jgi:hypothetical protein
VGDFHRSRIGWWMVETDGRPRTRRDMSCLEAVSIAATHRLWPTWPPRQFAATSSSQRSATRRMNS